MLNRVHTGYYGVFRPPYALEGLNATTIYCVSSENHEILLAIPLSHAFYRDMMKIIKTTPYENVALIAPDIGSYFISDYLNVWRDCKNLGINITIYSKFRPKGEFPPEFIADFREAVHALSFNLPFDPIDTQTVTVTLLDDRYCTSPTACDVVLSDSVHTMYFASWMDKRRVESLLKNIDKYDELHIPFSKGYYNSQFTYFDLVRTYPQFNKKIVPNNFDSREQFNAVREYGTIGWEVYNNDFI